MAYLHSVDYLIQSNRQMVLYNWVFIHWRGSFIDNWV